MKTQIQIWFGIDPDDIYFQKTLHYYICSILVLIALICSLGKFRNVYLCLFYPHIFFGFYLPFFSDFIRHFVLDFIHHFVLDFYPLFLSTILFQIFTPFFYPPFCFRFESPFFYPLFCYVFLILPFHMC